MFVFVKIICRFSVSIRDYITFHDVGISSHMIRYTTFQESPFSTGIRFPESKNVFRKIRSLSGIRQFLWNVIISIMAIMGTIFIISIIEIISIKSITSHKNIA